MTERELQHEAEWAAFLALSGDVPTLVPVGLRGSVLASSQTKRVANLALDHALAISPIGALTQTIDDLHHLLCGLADDEWDRPAVPVYGRVRDVIAHLVGVEESLLGLLGEGDRPDPVMWTDHIAATRSFVSRLSGSSTPSLIDRWVVAARRLASVAGASAPTRDILVNDIPTTIDGMLVLRTFEIWTHYDDICRATGRPLTNLDAARMRYLSTRLMDVLPSALGLRGVASPERTMRVVLTGAGGGVYERPMGSPAPDRTEGGADVTVVADAVDFCRMAANRLDPDDLRCEIEGDPTLARDILAATSVFARD